MKAVLITLLSVGLLASLTGYLIMSKNGEQHLESNDGKRVIYDKDCLKVTQDYDYYNQSLAGLINKCEKPTRFVIYFDQGYAFLSDCISKDEPQTVLNLTAPYMPILNNLPVPCE